MKSERKIYLISKKEEHNFLITFQTHQPTLQLPFDFNGTLKQQIFKTNAKHYRDDFSQIAEIIKNDQ